MIIYKIYYNISNIIFLYHYNNKLNINKRQSLLSRDQGGANITLVCESVTQNKIGCGSRWLCLPRVAVISFGYQPANLFHQFYIFNQVVYFCQCYFKITYHIYFYMLRVSSRFSCVKDNYYYFTFFNLRLYICIAYF